MRSTSGALSANGLWYVLVGLFIMFSFKPVADALSLAQPDNGNFYSVLGAAAMIGLGVTAASLARSYTAAGVGGIIVANIIVLITMLYWLLVVKATGALNTTGSLVLWIAFAILLIITLAEIGLNRGGWRRR
jgi:hypothetical protein